MCPTMQQGLQAVHSIQGWPDKRGCIAVSNEWAVHKQGLLNLSYTGVASVKITNTSALLEHGKSM